jgi:3-oxoacyl-[acyl-carrier-protein] synthase-1/3-oxoacyl-[acyl-carrier-protein] synthase II
MHAALEALAAGAWLVQGGDADRVVVVAADDVGPVTRELAGGSLRSGAVAVLVTSCRADVLARVGAVSLRRGDPAEVPFAPGHLALLPLVAAAGPCRLACASPPDAHARIELV